MVIYLQDGKTVILIFSIQGSGHFQGFARFTPHLADHHPPEFCSPNLGSCYQIEWLKKLVSNAVAFYVFALCILFSFYKVMLPIYTVIYGIMCYKKFYINLNVPDLFLSNYCILLTYRVIDL